MNELVLFIRFPALTVGGVCLALSITSYVRSESETRRSGNYRREANVLEDQCNNLNGSLRLLSEKWRA